MALAVVTVLLAAAPRADACCANAVNITFEGQGAGPYEVDLCRTATVRVEVTGSLYWRSNIELEILVYDQGQYGDARFTSNDSRVAKVWFAEEEYTATTTIYGLTVSQTEQPGYELKISACVCEHLSPVCGSADFDVVCGSMNSYPLRDACPSGPTDSDSDGKPDGCDDCPNDPENDVDEDGVCGDVDNCPDTPNGPSLGTCIEGDEESLGEPCVDDDECDEPGQSNGKCSLNQEDEDDDTIGDACDNCYPGHPNHNCTGTGCANTDQADTDGDLVGDECDTCTDSDDDGYGDPDFQATNICENDNCPYVPNPGQDDFDTCEGGSNDGKPCDSDVDCPDGECAGDGIGDACDPDRAVSLEFDYDETNRVTEIRRNETELVTYEYDGRDMTRRRTRTEYADLATVNPAPADAYIDYQPAYDIHGRITKITNLVYSAAQGATARALATYTYEFDDAGNRTTQIGASGPGWPSGEGGFAYARQVGYTYDRLHRVTQAEYDATPANLTTSFEYDLVGNRNTVYDGLNSVTRSYLSNKANEYTKVSVGLSPTDDYEYDVRGNLSLDDGFDEDPDDRFEYTYDPENRLTGVAYDPDGPGAGALTVVAEYRYDSQGRRIEFIDSVREITTRYYYDGPNVIVETNQTDTARRSYVNGTQYIDERVLMRDHTQDPIVGDDRIGQDHYYLLKDLYTVAGLVSRNGAPEEYYVYDTYGQAVIYEWPPGDVDRDGTTEGYDGDDANWVNSRSGEPEPLADVDLDGDVDTDDEDAVDSWDGQSALELTYSSLDNPYFFTGRITDTLHASDLLVENDENFRRIQDNRNRTYDPKHGRWLQRDPAGYVDGVNLYEYALGTPTRWVDPQGTDVIGDCDCERLIRAHGIRDYMMIGFGAGRVKYFGPAQRSGTGNGWPYFTGDDSEDAAEIIARMIRSSITFELETAWPANLKPRSVLISVPWSNPTKNWIHHIDARITILNVVRVPVPIIFDTGDSYDTWNDDYWDGFSVRKGVTPYAAVNDVWERGGYRMACTMGTGMVMARAWSLFDPNFNYLNYDDRSLKNITPWNSVRTYWLREKNVNGVNKWDDVVPGDWLRLKSAFGAPGGLQGENLIHVGGNEFWGLFDADDQIKTDKEWISEWTTIAQEEAAKAKPPRTLTEEQARPELEQWRRYPKAGLR